MGKKWMQFSKCIWKLRQWSCVLPVIMFSCLESANLQKKLTKIGLFHRWVLVELNPLNDDGITELLCNQLLQLEEFTLCWDLDPDVEQCGCCAVDDWHWIWFHASEFLLFCSFSYSQDPLTCNHLQQSPDDITRWWRTVLDYEDQIAKKTERLTTKNHQGNGEEPRWCWQRRRDVQNNNRPSVLVDACSIVERSKRQIEVAGSWEHRHHRGHPSTILKLHSIAPPQGDHKWRCSSSSRNSQCDHSQLLSPSFLNFCK